MDQCTARLGLNQAARRLYTADGTLVMDLDDLVEYTQQQYADEAKEEIKAQRRAKKAAALAAEGKNGESLMSKVQLDSDEEEEDEEEPEKPAENGNAEQNYDGV